MKHQVPITAPDAGSILKFAVPLVWKWKWTIAVGTIFAAILTYALMASSKVDIWGGRAVLSVGLAPASEFIAQKSGPAMSPIETPRRTVARLSDPAFQDLIVKRTAFEPETASVSRSMVASSLRGIVLDKERDIVIELSAGSAADVQSAFRVIAAEISAVHSDILNRQIEVVQSRIDEDKARLAAIEKEIVEFNMRVTRPPPPPWRNEPPSSPVTSTILMAISARNELQNLIRSDTALARLSEPTALRVNPDNIFVTHRSI